MCEISGTNYIVSRRMLDHRRMVNLPDYIIQAGGKKFSLPSCSTRPDYPDGGRRYSKSGYRQRTSYFSSDRSALASAVSVSSPVRARKGCSASWAQAAHSTAKNQCYYRGYPPYDATRCPARIVQAGTHWSTRSMAKALGVSKATVCPDMATAQSQATSCRDIQTQSRQAVCRETSRYRWAISQSARQSTGLVCRRKESDPSSRPNATFITFTPRPSGASDTRLYTAWNDNFIRCLEHARWKGHRRLHAQTPASRIYPVLTTRKCQNPAGFGFASYRRQLWRSQAPTGHKLAQASSSVPLALYSNIQFMAEYGGTLVPGNYRQTYSPWFIQKRSGSNQGNYAVSRQSQPKSTRFYLERISRTDYGKERQM